LSQVVVSTAAGYGYYFRHIFIDPCYSAIVSDENVRSRSSSDYIVASVTKQDYREGGIGGV
jgi:hypothetical protein